jgi:hypothetical protein
VRVQRASASVAVVHNVTAVVGAVWKWTRCCGVQEATTITRVENAPVSGAATQRLVEVRAARHAFALVVALKHLAVECAAHAFAKAVLSLAQFLALEIRAFA